jgi:hypothetical protein
MKKLQPRRPKTWLVALAFAMLSGLTLWSYGEMLAKRLLAEQARTATQRCAELAGEMPESLNSAQKKGYVHTEVLWLPQKLMEEAGQRAGLPLKSIQTTSDSAGVRVKGTDYLEQEIAVRLEDLTLAELIRFLLEVDSPDAKFVFKKLELVKSASRGDDNASERWTPRNLILSYYIVSPNSKSSK